jgi:hypothetical protein
MEIFKVNWVEILIGLLVLFSYLLTEQKPKKKKKTWSSRLAELLQELWEKLVETIMKKPINLLKAWLNRIVYFAYIPTKLFISLFFALSNFCLGLLILALHIINQFNRIVLFYMTRLRYNFLNIFRYWNLLYLRLKAAFSLINLFWFCWSIPYFNFIQKFRFLVYIYLKFMWTIIYIIKLVNSVCNLIYYLFCVFILYVQSYVQRDCYKLFWTTLDLLTFWSVAADIFKNAFRVYFVFFFEFLWFIGNLYDYPRRKNYFKKLSFFKIYNFITELSRQLMRQKFFLIKVFIHCDTWITYYIKFKWNRKNVDF